MEQIKEFQEKIGYQVRGQSSGRFRYLPDLRLPGQKLQVDDEEEIGRAHV